MNKRQAKKIHHQNALDSIAGKDQRYTKKQLRGALKRTRRILGLG